ncbi:unnamed protein product, partial [Iphiclides podalirius]
MQTAQEKKPESLTENEVPYPKGGVGDRTNQVKHVVSSFGWPHSSTTGEVLWAIETSWKMDKQIRYPQ